MEELATKDNTYEICNEQVQSYHYNIKRSATKRNLKKYTPFKQNILPVSRYEGEYHPTCKVLTGGYENYNTSETQILYKDLVIFDIKFPSMDNINNVLLAAFIACQFHSLKLRVTHDIVTRQGNVDKPHINAGLYSTSNLYKSLKFLYENTDHDYFECVDDSIYKNFGSLEKIEIIYEQLKRGNKENIMKYYNDYLETTSITKRKLFK